MALSGCGCPVYEYAVAYPNPHLNQPATNRKTEAKAAATKQSDRLDNFQLVPKDAEGKLKLLWNDLFAHVIKLRNAKFAKRN